MHKINNEKLKQIKGGTIHWGIVASIGAAVSFIMGIIDGWSNPQRCNR